MRFHVFDHGQQVAPIAHVGGHGLDRDQQFTGQLFGHLPLAPIKTLRRALAAMPHLEIGQADDPIRCRALRDLRLAGLIRGHVIAQNLGQQPRRRSHLGIVDLFERTMKGEIAAALDRLRGLYRAGADPADVLIEKGVVKLK